MGTVRIQGYRCGWSFDKRANPVTNGVEEDDSDDGTIRAITIGRAAMESFVPVSCCASRVHCVVCLQHVEMRSSCRVLQCGHAFHPDCILDWWTRRPQSFLLCPTCKQWHTSDSEVGASDPQETSVGQTCETPSE